MKKFLFACMLLSCTVFKAQYKVGDMYTKDDVSAVKGWIWDNRYMAVEERAEGSDLTVTSFRKVSGGEFLPGMLIREIKAR